MNSPFRHAVTLSTSATLPRIEWERPDLRQPRLRTMRHRLIHNALDAGLGFVTWPAVTTAWCSSSEWDVHGHRVDHHVPAASPDATTVVVTLTAQARPLRRAPSTGVPVISRYAKAVAAFVGGALQVVNIAALPERWQSWIGAALAVLTVLGVRQFPNTPAPEAAPAADTREY